MGPSAPHASADGSQIPPALPSSIGTQAHHAPHPSLEALFSFVHLDTATGKAAPVSQLQLETAADREVFQQRQAVADARRAARQQQHVEGRKGEWQAGASTGLLSRPAT